MQFYFFNFGVTMSTSPDFFWGADSIMMLPYFNKSLEAEPSGAFFGRYKFFDKYYIAIVANFSTNINIYTSKIYKGSYQTTTVIDGARVHARRESILRTVMCSSGKLTSTSAI